MEKTAAGEVQVIDSAKCPARGNTRVFFGTLADGRYVVSSRFEYYVKTSDRSKAEKKFREMCNVSA